MKDELSVHIEGIAECVLVKKRKHARKVKYPLQTKATSDEPEALTEVADDEQNDVEKSIVVDIVKADHEEQTVTGVVLQPEVTDSQGDIMSAEVIKQTAYDFLAGFNKITKLGVQHSVFKKGQLELVESYIAPIDMVLGLKTIKKGSWIMTVRVLSAALWKKVKEGKITGFSIGGKATVTASI